MVQLAGNRVVPGDRIRSRGKVIPILEDKPGCLHGFNSLCAGAHVANPVSALDTQSDGSVVAVRLVELVCHYPFIDPEAGAGFEDAEDLLVCPLEAGRVDGCFDDIDRIEAVAGEVQMLLLLVSKLRPGLDRGLCSP